jgi:hypothetical protein
MASNGRRIKLCEFGKRRFFPYQSFFILRTLFPDVFKTYFLPLIKGDFFPCRPFPFPRARFVPTDVLSCRLFCRQTFCLSGRFVPPNDLSRWTFSPQTFCPSGRFFPRMFWCRTFCLGTLQRTLTSGLWECSSIHVVRGRASVPASPGCQLFIFLHEYSPHLCMNSSHPCSTLPTSAVLSPPLQYSPQPCSTLV